MARLPAGRLGERLLFRIRPDYRSAESKNTCPYNIIFPSSALVATIGVLSIRHEAHHDGMVTHLVASRVGGSFLSRDPPAGGTSEGFCRGWQ